jgi:hypothetical protein
VHHVQAVPECVAGIVLVGVGGVVLQERLAAVGGGEAGVVALGEALLLGAGLAAAVAGERVDAVSERVARLVGVDRVVLVERGAVVGGGEVRVVGLRGALLRGTRLLVAVAVALLVAGVVGLLDAAVAGGLFQRVGAIRVERDDQFGLLTDLELGDVERWWDPGS